MPIAGFPTTLNPTIQMGFTPVFVDIELDTLNLDLDQVERVLEEQPDILELQEKFKKSFDDLKGILQNFLDPEEEDDSMVPETDSNIEDELERNRTMLDIERYQYQSDSDPEPEEYEGDYDLRRYRDEEYDSDTLPAYDYKKITKHYSDKLPK